MMKQNQQYDDKGSHYKCSNVSPICLKVCYLFAIGISYLVMKKKWFIYIEIINSFSP